MTPIRRLVGTGVFLLAVVPGAVAQSPPTVVARTGTGAGSVDVNSISPRPIVGGTASGTYAFAAAHDIDGFDTSLWYGTAGATTRILRVGDAAPGVAGNTVAGLNNQAISPTGTLVFRGTLSNGVNQRAVWTYTAGGGFQLVARTGAPAPGTAANWSALYFDQFPAVDAAGRVAFAGEAGSGNFGIWTGTAGAVSAAVLKGQQAPDLPAGVAYNQFGQLFSGPRVNAGGDLVFRATLSNTGSIDTDAGIFAGPAGGRRLIAQAGTQAPGTAAGVRYFNLDAPKMADTGRVAFNAQLAGPGVTAANDLAVFVGRPGQPTQLVAREGDAAPGIGGGATFTSLSNFGVKLGGAGHVVFFGEVAGGGVTTATNQAFWYGADPANLGLLVRRGDAAPGVPGGTFTNLTPVTDSGPVVNGTGVVVFRATAADAFGSFEGLWGGTPGDLRLLARQGQVFDINPDPGVTDNRTLTGFGYLPIYSTNSGHTALTDDGVFVFYGTFNGGQAVLSTVVPVPEPAAVLAVAAAGLGLGRWGRRRGR